MFRKIWTEIFEKSTKNKKLRFRHKGVFKKNSDWNLAKKYFFDRDQKKKFFFGDQNFQNFKIWKSQFFQNQNFFFFLWRHVKNLEHFHIYAYHVIKFTVWRAFRQFYNYSRRDDASFMAKVRWRTVHDDCLNHLLTILIQCT